MNTDKIDLEQIKKEYSIKPKSIKIWSMDGNAKAVRLNGHPKYFFSFSQPNEYIWLDFMYPDLNLDGIHIAKTFFQSDTHSSKINLKEIHHSINNSLKTEFQIDVTVDNDSFKTLQFTNDAGKWVTCDMTHPRELIRTQNHQLTDLIITDRNEIKITRFLMYESRILLHLNETAPVSCSKLMTISHNLNNNTTEFTETLIKLSNGMPAYFSRFVGPEHIKYDSLSKSPSFEFDETEYRMYYESLPLHEFQL